MTQPVSEVLNLAADLIEERGWGRGPLAMMGVSGLCLEGAVYAAAFGRFGDASEAQYDAVQECPAGLALHAYLAPLLAETGNRYAWGWNDAPGRTATEVVAALRAAALIEAARENAETRQPVTA